MNQVGYARLLKSYAAGEKKRCDAICKRTGKQCPNEAIMLGKCMMHIDAEYETRQIIREIEAY